MKEKWEKSTSVMGDQTPSQSGGPSGDVWAPGVTSIDSAIDIGPVGEATKGQKKRNKKDQKKKKKQKRKEKKKHKRK